MKNLHRFKILVVVAIHLFATATVVAQSPELFFEQQSPYPNLHPGTHHLYSNVLEVSSDDGSEDYCLVVMYDAKGSCYEYETESVFKPIVYKVSTHGALLGELALGFENRYTELTSLYRAPDNPQCFLGVGKVHDNELHYDRPFLAKFDQGLNLLWQREVELPEPYREHISFGSVMDGDGRIFCSSYLYECLDSAPYSCFFFRLTSEGELDGILDSPLVSKHKNPFVFPDGTRDYGSLECVEENQYQLMLSRVSQNLETVEQTTVPNSYKEFHPVYSFITVNLTLYPTPIPTIIPVPDGSMILANDAYLSLQDFSQYDLYYGVGFLKVDSVGNAVSYAMDNPVALENGQQDSLRYMAGGSLVGDDAFYFVYNIGAPGGWGYDWMNCFVVGKMDLEGNLLWRRYWNRYTPELGMKVYYPSNVVTSLDGGCLVTGQSYESDVNAPGTSNNENSVFLIKFFADGTLDVPLETTNVRPYCFFPNPVDDRLHMEFSPDVTPRQIELYDLQGRLVGIQNNGFEGVEMRQLPSGTYTIRIVMKDGTSYSDKIVKH